jgi:hypothetical protein
MRHKYDFDLHEVIKQELGFFEKMSMPPFPSLEIDGDIVFSKCEVSAEILEAEILKRF